MECVWKNFIYKFKVSVIGIVVYSYGGVVILELVISVK